MASNLVFTSSTVLYAYDASTGYFVAVGEYNEGDVEVYSTQNKDSYLRITCNDAKNKKAVELIKERIIDTPYFEFVSETSSFVFTISNINKELKKSLKGIASGPEPCFSLKFDDEDVYKEFRLAWAETMYDIQSGKQFDKLTEEQREYVVQMICSDFKEDPQDNSDMEDVEYNAYFEDAVGGSEEGVITIEDSDYEDEEQDEDEEDEEVEEIKEVKKPAAKKIKNQPRLLRSSAKGKGHTLADKPRKGYKGHVIRYKDNLTFATRDGAIDVYRYNDSDLKSDASFEVKNSKGKALEIKRAILTNGETNMLAMDDLCSSVFNLDLGTGKVVSEYQLPDKIIDISNKSKYGQRESDQTFVGFGSNSINLFDPRLREGIVNEQLSNTYKSINNMTAGATSGNGELVTASSTGDIRLYKALGAKRATSLFEGIGEKVTSVEVSNDGEWILATCDKFLLLYKTQSVVNGKDNVNFWTKSVAERKPQAIRLQLRPQHWQLVGSDNNFNAAKFDVNDSKLNSHIIASVGNHVIKWNFRTIKANKNRDIKYTISKFSTKVQADSFFFNQSRQYVVTSEDNVGVVTKKDEVTN